MEPRPYALFSRRSSRTTCAGRDGVESSTWGAPSHARHRLSRRDRRPASCAHRPVGFWSSGKRSVSTPPGSVHHLQDRLAPGRAFMRGAGTGAMGPSRACEAGNRSFVWNWTGVRDVGRSTSQRNHASLPADAGSIVRGHNAATRSVGNRSRELAPPSTPLPIAIQTTVQNPS